MAEKDNMAAKVLRKNPPRKAKTVATSRLSTISKSTSSKRTATSRTTPTETTVTRKMTESRAASTTITAPKTPTTEPKHKLSTPNTLTEYDTLPVLKHPTMPTECDFYGIQKATSTTFANTSAVRTPSPPPVLERGHLQPLCYPTHMLPRPTARDYSATRLTYSPTYTFCDPSNPRYDPADPLLASPSRTHDVASSAAYDPASPRYSPTSPRSQRQREQGT